MQATMEAPPRAFRPELRDRVGTSTRTPGWDLSTERRLDDGKTLSRMIGWFSLGLGTAQVLAPERLGEFLGKPEADSLIRLYGLRELTKGAGILMNRRPEGWMQARIAGDALDLATLAMGLRDNPKRGRVLAAMGAVVGVAVLDVIAAAQLGERPERRADRNDYRRPQPRPTLQTQEMYR